MRYLTDIKYPLLLSLTLGLAPFAPEPHIWGKVLWIAGGAKGMTVIDWFDAVLHGFPWVWLLGVLIYKIFKHTRT